LQGFSCYLLNFPRHVDTLFGTHASKEYYMITFLKWIVTALVAALMWLVGKYTVEYFDTKNYNR